MPTSHSRPPRPTPSSRAQIVGVDIGATTIKAAPVDLRRGVVVRAPVSIPTPRGARAILDAASELVLRAAGRGARLGAVGVGSAGLVSAEGVVLETTDTLPGWAGVDIPRELAKRLSVPCRADNDGNAAALAEATFGAGRGLGTVAMLTLGTGVGGGLVIGGRIFHGAGSMAATFGHLPVRPGGSRCACGARGCLEAYASAWAMRRARGGGEPDEVFRRARGGDPRARALVDAAADALGVAFAQIAHAINPDAIVLGGGIARGFGALRAGALRRYGELALARAHETTAIRRARLGTAAGIVGAGLLARG